MYREIYSLPTYMYIVYICVFFFILDSFSEEKTSTDYKYNIHTDD